MKRYEAFLESKEMMSTLPASVLELHALFRSAGKKLYLVGGSVRDFLKGDKPKDFDLATDALPDEVISIIGNRYRTDLQGKAFGVVVVYTKDQPEGFEIATFRKDISRGRNPEVELGVSIEDDVKRRDLTYNSLFFDLDKKEIVDLVGGRKDLEDGITRMVGDPHERFEEDSLRILRAFRFASRYGHPLHKDTADAIKKRGQLENIDPDTGDMKRISQERIWEEFKKAWKQAKDFGRYLDFFFEFDMWKEAFPGSAISKPFQSESIEIVVASLFRDNPTQGLEKKMVQDYKIEHSIAKKAVFLIEMLQFDPDSVLDFYKKKESAGVSAEMLLEWLGKAGIGEPAAKLAIWKPTVSAEELMAKGIKGKALGIEIKRLEAENFKK